MREPKFLLAIWMGNGMALVPSRTEEGVYHAADLTEGTCACKDNQIGQNKCWHLKELEKAVLAQIV